MATDSLPPLSDNGIAYIKPEYVWKKPSSEDVSVSGNGEAIKVKSEPPDEGGGEPQLKKLKVEDGANESSNKKQDDRQNYRERKRGQNKPKDRPAPKKEAKEEKLCPHLLDGPQDTPCSYLPSCPFLHDIDVYLASKPEDVKIDCYLFKTYGKCPRGLTCRFALSHIIDGKNVVNQDLWNAKRDLYEQTHAHLLPKEKMIELRKRKFDFKPVEVILSKLQPHPPKTAESSSNGTTRSSNGLENTAEVPAEKLGPVSDEDIVPLRTSEVRKIDWTDKLYLSPLTTVGNLPFRRLCVEFGADITCSEMSLATSLLQGNTHEFALHRRHPSEKLWGVQLCANNGFIAAKAAYVLQDCGIPFDFIDLNMGCPLDAIYRQGAGSGLMCRANKFHSMVRSMVAVLGGFNKPFTVKMRKGVQTEKNIAHNLISYCRDAGVSLVTLHGRSREQRYLKTADWHYIGECVKLAKPMPVFGNGDILSWEEYNEKKSLSNAPGVMIGRGALMKPWIFQEIKEQRHIDMNATHRMEILQKFVNYGLDHWGSDNQGVATTRRFLLEFLSFFCRYIPYGILERPPQKVNQKPPRYVGRDEMETLLASPSAVDWVKISEMLLGSVPADFLFVPKHKASAW